MFVRPAVEGTRNVLASVALAPSVKRVVLTSSIIAVHGTAADKPGGVFTEDDWNRTSTVEVCRRLLFVGVNRGG